MKTETKKSDKCQVKLIVTLDADEVKTCVKDVEREFVRQARLPGFRPGKAPIDLIRKDFAGQLKEEETRAILRKYYSDAVKAEAIDEIALAGVEQMDFNDKGGSFTAIVEVKPTFKLPTYKGLKIAFNDTKVEDAAVAEQVERMRKASAKYEDSKDGEAAAEGDYIQIDYTGTVGGKSILEIAPDAKVVAEGKGFWTQLEEGHFLKEILEATKGMKSGETKEGVKVTFDKNAAPEALKGKKAVYSVTLKTFRRRVLPTDAEFAQRQNVESVEALTKTIREQMEKQSVQQEETRRENEAVELLLKKVDFDVPPSQVQRAMDNYLSELAQRAQYAGLSAEYFEQNRDKILKDAQENAEKQVRLWHVIDAIAKAEGIDLEDKEKGKKVIELVLANAKK